MTTTPEATPVAFDREVSKYAREGYSVVDRTPTQVTLQRKKKIGALKPVLLVLLACTVAGIFFIPLVLGILNRKVETVVISVDDRGKVRVKKS